MESNVNEIFKKVQKPARYIGGEYNSVVKNPQLVKAEIALAFPDLYEVGMSYLGHKILYSLINKHPGYAAERVFAPWTDFEKELRERNLPLFSLENRIPLFLFDILGFSLLYELNYSNILTILDLGKIPFRSRERGNTFPLVGAGGPAVFNPEPVADIFDFFLIGDGEEGFLEIIETYIKTGGKESDRTKQLKEISKIPGVYVPGLYKVSLSYSGGLQRVTPKAGSPFPIQKRLYVPFEQAFFPEDIIVPHVSAVFDRVSVEAMRGCPQGCRFCQAYSVYFPSRVKDPSLVMKNVIRSLESTGYEEASLASLSISDYPYIKELVGALMQELKGKNISLSLSSLRPGGVSRDIIENILKVRKTGMTIVPEAGTERLRRIINKKVTDDEIFSAAAGAFSLGWKLLKLYFMVGLPFEREEDLDGIVQLVEKIISLGRSEWGGRPGLNLSVSSFIPKPHTPFQWLAMDGENELKKKHYTLQKRLKKMPKVKVKGHPIKNSILEGIFSRGDRRLNEVLITAWKDGARFDGWSEQFNYTIWENAFKKTGLDPSIFLASIPLDAGLPWDHIRTGIKKETLLREWEKAETESFTPSCWERQCADCRGCDRPQLMRRDFSKKLSPSVLRNEYLGKKTEGIKRYRATYRKTGEARFLSHIEMNNAIQRSFRRAGISLIQTEGFHPKMKISFLPALPLGMEGEGEMLEFQSERTFSEKSFLERVNRYLPGGLFFVKLERLSSDEPKLNNVLESALYVLDLKSPEVRKKNPPDPKDMVDMLYSRAEENEREKWNVILYDEKNEVLYLETAFHSGRFPRIQEVFEEMFGIENAVYALSRRKVFLRSKGKF